MIRLFLLFLISSNICISQKRPNIIYIMSDDHDADAISAYNKTFIKTPNIDRIAKKRGIIYQKLCRKFYLWPGKGNINNRPAFS